MTRVTVPRSCNGKLLTMLLLIVVASCTLSYGIKWLLYPEFALFAYALDVKGWIAYWRGEALASGFGSATTAADVVRALAHGAAPSLALVTGANSGIGLETARALAVGGIDVILGCRSLEKAESAKRAIIGRDHESWSGGAIICIGGLDLSSLLLTKRFAAEVAALRRPLDILILNAGVMAPPLGVTTDGVEVQFQVRRVRDCRTARDHRPPPHPARHRVPPSPVCAPRNATLFAGELPCALPPRAAAAPRARPVKARGARCCALLCRPLSRSARRAVLGDALSPEQRVVVKSGAARAVEPLRAGKACRGALRLRAPAPL